MKRGEKLPKPRIAPHPKQNRDYRTGQLQLYPKPGRGQDRDFARPGLSIGQQTETGRRGRPDQPRQAYPGSGGVSCLRGPARPGACQRAAGLAHRSLTELPAASHDGYAVERSGAAGGQALLSLFSRRVSEVGGR